MTRRDALAALVTKAINDAHGYTQSGVGETVVVALEGLIGAKAPEASELTPKVRATITQLCDCLEDVASGKGGWAWEEVLQEARALL